MTIEYLIKNWIFHIPVYIEGFLLTFFIIFTYQLLGTCLTKNKKNDSYSFVAGFMAFSFPIALVGIIVQILDLPYMLFFVSMIILWLGTLIFIFFSIKKNRIDFNKSVIKKYFKNNWYLYIGSFVILLFALMHVDSIWENNLTDDSFYICKMATAPYVNSLRNTDFGSGISGCQGISYLLNTFELEGSFYVYISHLSATLYARFFLALLNYFILLNVIHAFFFKVISKKDSLVKYLIPIAFILIVMNSAWFTASKQTWTITSAAYFGSALVRVGTPFFCLLPLIDEEKLSFKSIFITIVVCTVLMSKSTIALPILFVLAVSYLLLISNKYIKIIISLAIIIAGIIIPDSTEINTYMLKMGINYFKYILFLIPLFSGVYLAYKNLNYRKIYIIYIISVLLMFVPELNDIYELLSQFDFVADRCMYSVSLFFLVITYTYLVYYFIQLLKDKFRVIPVLKLSFVVIFAAVSVIGTDRVSLKKSIVAYAKSPDIVPVNTEILAKELKSYTENTGEILSVFCYTGVNDSGMSHFPGQILRAFAPDVISPIALIRTSSVHEGDDDYDGFSVEKAQTLISFTENPKESVSSLQSVVDAYPFNCIVVEGFTEEHDNYLESIGFYKYKDLGAPSYYQIYIKGYNH